MELARAAGIGEGLVILFRTGSGGKEKQHVVTSLDPREFHTRKCGCSSPKVHHAPIY
jgi:hypothetical protein